MLYYIMLLHLMYDDFSFCFFFFFNDTATTEIYTLSLHDALPIYAALRLGTDVREAALLRLGHRNDRGGHDDHTRQRDRKSTRLNSSHLVISYAVLCLEKKKKKTHIHVSYTVTNVDTISSSS